MKLLLTSGGIKNSSIRDALVGMLDKPISESTPSAFPPPCTPSLAVPCRHGG